MEKIIVGGARVPITAAPYAAQVQSQGQFMCTGAVIAPGWALSAKHCAGEDMSVLLGSAELGDGDLYQVRRQVPWPSGDLLLLELATQWDGKVADLGSTEVPLGTDGSIFGWGRTTPEGPPAAHLRIADVIVTASETDAYGGAAYRLSGSDGQAWKGDSGGPFVVDGVVQGIASTSASMGSDPYSDAWYTKVAPAYSWIQSVMNGGTTRPDS